MPEGGTVSVSGAGGASGIHYPHTIFIALKSLMGMTVENDIAAV